MNNRPLKVALLGLGNVGAALASELQRRGDAIADRAGGRLELVGAAVRDPARARPGVPESLGKSADPMALALREDVDIVVELMGGTGLAGEVVRAALAAGKAVVTANKALVASDADRLFALAKAHDAPLGFEAAVAGAIPALRALEVSLAGDRIRRVAGIVNGTCNYILTRMEVAGLDFDAALGEAQRLGFAEADPSSDVDGEDAAYKLTILARLALGAAAAPEAVSREGIRGVRAEDLRRAAEVDLVVRLLAIAERGDDGAIDLRVHPTLVPKEHPLAAVRGAMNAVWVEAEAAGPLMFYGAGAGGLPTASAVLGDLVAVAQRVRGGAGAVPRAGSEAAKLVDPGARQASVHVACLVADEPGVLAAIAGAFARHGVSVESCVQHGRHADPVELVFVTHRCREAALDAALAEVGALPAVREVASRLRVQPDAEG
ncbi:MAG: homoserine dehydrogenase [Deltaproteobacteria bacterium]|nr:homoserine dehydrogenase [Deltaproteobacteria bacterium]